MQGKNSFRSEAEMFKLIIEIANSDDRIRAAYLNGSRANPNVSKDSYQDYDIVYVVNETASFLDNKHWVNTFGNIAMVQEPDSNDFRFGIEADFTQSYAWLILFKDGNRIDLNIIIKSKALTEYNSDGLTIELLDKDNILPTIPKLNDDFYHIKRPTLSKYLGCCNEFWWCLNNVAKGIARDELPYAMEMFNHYVRDMLNIMVEWHIGTITDFSVSAGKMGKYFKKYLSHDLYEMYQKTYSDYNYTHLWDAVFTACELFRTLAINISTHFNYPYNQNDDINMTAYLNTVKNSISEKCV